MYPSVLFHNLTEEEIDLFLSILSNIDESFTVEECHEFFSSNCREQIIQLVSKGFLSRKEDRYFIPTTKEMTKLMLTQEYRYISYKVSDDSEQNYLEEIKNYLSTVQKQLVHVETESRKAFLNIRKMVDKISDQGKEHLNIAFEKALDKNTETGAWVSIPHVSPVGLYEPIEEIKEKFNHIIKELENSLASLVHEYTSYTNDLIRDEDINLPIMKNLENKERSLLNETKQFNEEVLISLHEQINLLEKNLGKDLMEQFDAIERLNDLKPERVWMMLEDTRTELNMYLNNVYSRILREINTLQLKVDISNISLILTNEAGKAIKKVEKIKQTNVKNLRPLRELLSDLEE